MMVRVARSADTAVTWTSCPMAGLDRLAVRLGFSV